MAARFMLSGASAHKMPSKTKTKASPVAKSDIDTTSNFRYELS